MTAAMDHIAGSGDDTTRSGGADGFATLWSDMPQDVRESVHLSAGQAPCVARLTMSGPTGKVEISITPRGMRAEGQRPAIGGVQPRPAHPQACTTPAEEEDKKP